MWSSMTSAHIVYFNIKEVYQVLQDLDLINFDPQNIYLCDLYKQVKNINIYIILFFFGL